MFFAEIDRKFPWVVTFKNFNTLYTSFFWSVSINFDEKQWFFVENWGIASGDEIWGSRVGVIPPIVSLLKCCLLNHSKVLIVLSRLRPLDLILGFRPVHGYDITSACCLNHLSWWIVALFVWWRLQDQVIFWGTLIRCHVWGSLKRRSTLLISWMLDATRF